MKKTDAQLKEYATARIKNSGKIIFNQQAECAIVKRDRLIMPVEDEKVKYFAKACLS